MVVENPIRIVPFTSIQDLYDMQTRHAVVSEYDIKELEGCYIGEEHLLSRRKGINTVRVNGKPVLIIPEYSGALMEPIEGESTRVKVLGIVYPTISAVIEEVVAIRTGNGDLYIAWDTII